jgi:hypothetical protein
MILSAIKPAFTRSVLNWKLRCPMAVKTSVSGDLRPNSSDKIRAIIVSASTNHHHVPSSAKSSQNPASAPQQGRQRGFCLGGSNAGTAPNPSVLQAANRPTAPAGPAGAGRCSYGMDHLVADQRGGRCSGYLATKSPDNNPVYAAGCIALFRRVPAFCINRLPLRDILWRWQEGLILSPFTLLVVSIIHVN